MQAGRPAQPSAADSPSSSHPRKGFCEASRAFRFLRCTAARVAPEGVPGQAHIHEPRGSAPRERDHRGGDHPVPSRTRQLSPPSPRVLQRQAAGGQGVALAEGAFLYARRMRRERPAGEVPPAGLSAFPGPGRGSPRSTPWVADLAGDRAGVQQARLGLRGDSSRVFYLGLRLAFALLVVMASSHLRYCCVLPLDFVGVFLFSGCWTSFWWV